jgi:DNA-binding NarL/FixJ family response regulator
MSSLEEPPMPSVLIVENNDFYRHSFLDILKFYLPTVAFTGAADSREALEEIEARPPDIIFVDIRLDDRNGLELTREIKARYPEIYVAVLTHYDYAEYRESAYRCGADNFLLKDAVTGAEIAEEIKRALREKKTTGDGDCYASIHATTGLQQPTG